jgi:hypothetical protein
MNEQKERVRVLRTIRQTLVSSHAFDDEDLSFIDDAIERESQIDEELLALQEKLPARMRLLNDIDKRYALTERFPDLAAKFLEKDADLQSILEDKLAALAARRT